MKDKFVLLIVSAGAFLVIYPVIFLLTGSFMHPSELQENLAPIVSPAAEGYADWSLLPLIPTIQSYVKVLLEEPQFFTVFWNSMKIVLGIMAGQALLGIPAAWGFARYEFRMKRILFFIYIILMMMPFQVIMLSEYLVLRNLSLLDSLWSIILPGAFSTFPVFVLYNFFRICAFGRRIRTEDFCEDRYSSREKRHCCSAASAVFRILECCGTAYDFPRQ